MRKLYPFMIAMVVLNACDPEVKELKLNVFETSASGNKLSEIKEFNVTDKGTNIRLLPELE